MLVGGLRSSNAFLVCKSNVLVVFAVSDEGIEDELSVDVR